MTRYLLWIWAKNEHIWFPLSTIYEGREYILSRQQWYEYVRGIPSSAILRSTRSHDLSSQEIQERSSCVVSTMMKLQPAANSISSAKLHQSMEEDKES